MEKNNFDKEKGNKKDIKDEGNNIMAQNEKEDNKEDNKLVLPEKEKEKIDKKLNEANTYANINSSNTNNFVSKNKSVILDDKNNLNMNIGNINFKNQMEM